MGSQVDQRTDFFAIGVMVVEVLTGQRPFSGASYHELLTNILQKAFQFADASREAHELNRVLEKCLSQDPASRFSSAAELQQELIPAMRRRPSVAVRQSAEPEAETAILNR